MKVLNRFMKLLGLGAMAMAINASAADFPDRPIRLVIPFPAGGNADIIARLLCMEWTKQLGQTIVIDNRGGANGIIGTDAVAKSPPDGYTLLFTTGSQAINPLISRKLPYDTMKDFTSIALTGVTESHVLVVNAASPIKSVKQLIEEGKSPDTKLSYGSAGVGNTMHLVAEYFKLLTNTHYLHVPYRGSAPAVNALAANEVSFLFLNPVGAFDQIKQGTFRALAVTGKQRSDQLPDVPTIGEAGVPQFDLDAGWTGIFGPANIPPDVVKKLNATLDAALKSPALKQRFIGLGMNPAGGPPSELDAYMKKDMAKFAEVVKAANIQPE
jgi:tripartite-type tricarboxylate transporter receptor subunit TctC